MKSFDSFKSILESDRNFLFLPRQNFAKDDLTLSIQDVLSWSEKIDWNKVQLLEEEIVGKDFHDFADDFASDLQAEFQLWSDADKKLSSLVASDMTAVISHFIHYTNAKKVKVKIEPVLDDMCRLFHVDNNKLRLLSSYCGAGTQWLTNDNVKREALGKGKNEDIVLDPQNIQQCQLLDILILKGEKWIPNNQGGAVHRSPPVVKGKERRLLLKIDTL
jgi:hypothetical protein